MLINARHFKIVSGRKTGVKDAEWLAELPRDGNGIHSSGRRRRFEPCNA
jgi:hypothetical protein